MHSAEIEYALGNLDTNPLYAWTAEDRAISKTMEGYFTAFIKTGDPNGAGLPRWLAATTGVTPSRQVIDVTSRSEPFTAEETYPRRVALLDRRPTGRLNVRTPQPWR